MGTTTTNGTTGTTRTNRKASAPLGRGTALGTTPKLPSGALPPAGALHVRLPSGRGLAAYLHAKGAGASQGQAGNAAALAMANPGVPLPQCTAVAKGAALGKLRAATMGGTLASMYQLWANVPLYAGPGKAVAYPASPSTMGTVPAVLPAALAALHAQAAKGNHKPLAAVVAQLRGQGAAWGYAMAHLALGERYCRALGQAATGQAGGAAATYTRRAAPAPVQGTGKATTRTPKGKASAPAAAPKAPRKPRRKAAPVATTHVAPTAPAVPVVPTTAT